MIEDSTRTMDSDEEAGYHTSTAGAETPVTAPDLLVHRISTVGVVNNSVTNFW